QGVYTYTLNNTSAAVQGLNDNEFLQESFSYTVTDADGDVSIAKVDIKINGSTDTPPTVVIENTDGNVTTADNSVVEDTGNTVLGIATVTAEAGIKSVTVGGIDVTGASAANPVVLPATAEGTLSITNYDAATGIISYSYTEALGADDHQAGDNSVIDSFTVTVTDNADVSRSDDLDIQIIDTVPVAQDDATQIGEDDVSVGGTVSIDAGADAHLITVQTDVVGNHGTFSINAQGVYTYTLNNTSAAVQGLSDNEFLEESFGYEVIDADGDKSTATVHIKINGNSDDPIITTVTQVTVSEEGLVNGIADLVGVPTDTTDAVINSGTISISDPDSTAFGVSITGPSGITSGGEPVTWSAWDSNTNTLTGTTVSGGEVITISLGSQTGSNGNYSVPYTVTLKGPIDHDLSGEDVKPLDFTVNVSDYSGGSVATSSLLVTVEDDSPEVIDSSNKIEISGQDTNLLVILDSSGSMSYSSGVPGKNRFQLAIEAIDNLIDGYNQHGAVMVRLVTFGSSARDHGEGWMTAEDAKTLLLNLPFSGGGTNYDAALAEAIASYSSTGKIEDANAVSYFISDGAPNGGFGISAADALVWQEFLQSENGGIKSIALGIGTNVPLAPLNPIGYDATVEPNTNDNAIIVAQLSDLDAVLQSTIAPANFSGNLLSSALNSSGFGGDGGHIAELTINGIVYTFDGTNLEKDGVALSGSNFTLVTALDGKLNVDMNDGSYTYQAKPGQTTASDEVIQITLRDNDGDLSSQAEILLKLTPETNVDIASNQVPTDANERIEGTDNSNTINAGGGNDRVFGELGEDTLNGEAGDDKLYGGRGGDILSGGDGDDILFGGLGNDTMSGGLGADIFTFTSDSNGQTDTILDFNVIEGDKLDLSDLLDTAQNSANLDQYLAFEKIGSDTVIHVDDLSGTTLDIKLKDIDLTANGNDTDQKIIDDLLIGNNLLSE
ncbi:MAG: VCBS domain-containing protein, partial [Oceanospirillaceae bacterium]